ncbi:MAG TPA: RyR domain-containing protein [Acetobacteraceae bacterium]|nr:RyR domain-containing protein [Acetobacteraceae bacterium]
MDAPARKLIVVAGDITIDKLAFTERNWPSAANSAKAPPRWHRTTRVVSRPGGALLLREMIKHAAPDAEVVSYDSNAHDTEALDGVRPEVHTHSFLDLDPVYDKRKEGDSPDAAPDVKSFAVRELRGFSGPGAHYPLVTISQRPALLVLDDAGNGFRDDPVARRVWEHLLWDQGLPDWVILKMGRPLADGALWEAIRPRQPPSDEPNENAGRPRPGNLVVIVNADDLREQDLRLSRRLSWECTAEDFVDILRASEQLSLLATCPHLIVRFGCEGVIHHRGSGPDRPVLFFDRTKTEGDTIDSGDGKPMIGLTAAFTAAFGAALLDSKANAISDGIRRGMAAACMLCNTGFVPANKTARLPDYPYRIIFTAPSAPASGSADPVISNIEIPAERISSDSDYSWRILNDVKGNADETARRIVREGLGKALGRVPIARFGDLTTADRREIEALRAVANLLAGYLDTASLNKPLSIAVFGPPGSGKSFGVKEVAKTLHGAKKRPVLEFNLSQFADVADLRHAFHQVRDKALSGLIPLVFFDEFDVKFAGDDLGWLKQFLAPMQDGVFHENGILHPLGRAIFVFAGGTTSSYREFNRDTEEFKAAKGPDFVSRLRGHVDILSLKFDSNDDTFAVRRAIQLRARLEKHAPHLVTGETLSIDDGVLHAFLTTPNFNHGARSLQAIVEMSRLGNEQRCFTGSALPPFDQLNMHVDANDFLSRVRRERLDDALREALGEYLHDAYRRHKEKDAVEYGVSQEKLRQDAAMLPWYLLSDDFKESSRRQADDIPRKLRKVQRFMAREIHGRAPAPPLEDPDISLLAQLEHARFNAERQERNWTQGPERDPQNRKSPFLVPWRDLAQRWQEFDRAAVEAIPLALASVGYRIYRTE